MWSVGVLTFDMLSGRLPFYSKDDHETLGKIKKGFNAEEQFN
jgi:serine/threonine protein kinase